MLGTNRDENKLFMFGDPALVRRILWIIPRAARPAAVQPGRGVPGEDVEGDGARTSPRRRCAPRQGPSVFVYRFDWDEEPTLLGRRPVR